MSEQDKRAEEVWREAFRAWSGVYPSDAAGTTRRKYRKAVAITDAALAQARREGVEAMRDGSAYLDAKARSLLAKEDA